MSGERFFFFEEEGGVFFGRRGAFREGEEGEGEVVFSGSGVCVFFGVGCVCVFFGGEGWVGGRGVRGRGLGGCFFSGRGGS